MNFNLHFGELHSDNSINDKNNFFENYIPKCYKVKRILISFNCFSEYIFKARDFNAISLSTYDFSTLYTTLPHKLIKDKLIDLIERTFQREGSHYLACNDRNAFYSRKA